MKVSEITRRDIIDALRIEGIVWHGRLEEVDFLSRLYNLKKMPSYDSRFSNAERDIWQHRVNNYDWEDDWVFTDDRFELNEGPDETFLRFLCEMLHPVVRSDGQEVAKLVKIFNQHLAGDGWEVVSKTYISGKPVYAARHVLVHGSPAMGAVKSLVKGIDAEYVTQQITRMEAAIEPDPELAIGTAKEFVETICKTILRESGEAVSSNADLPQLVKQVREKLELLPDDISDKAKGSETIKRILSNIGTVAQGLAELRGLYGSGHGKDAKVKGLKPRHARLAVGGASTLGVFLFETYQARKANKV